MSESSRNASRSLKLSPPRSLMNLEDAEEIWTIITKRYPKAAPLLCEMETVLDHAEDLLEQLKSPSDLGIVLSNDGSLNAEEYEEAVSDQTNVCDQSLAKSSEFDSPCVLDTQQYNLDDLTLTETMYTDGKSNEISFINDDSKINATSFCSTYIIDGTDCSFDEIRDDREENLKNPDTPHSEDLTQTTLIKNTTQANNNNENYNKGSRPSSASKIVGNPVTRLLQSPMRQRTQSEESKIAKTVIPKLKGSPRKHSNEKEVSIPQFKKVVEKIRLNEWSSQLVNKTETLKSDKKPHDKLEEVADIIRMKIKDSASIDAWDKVVGNITKPCETSPCGNTVKLANEKYDREITQKLINKTDVSLKSTRIPLIVEANIPIQSKKSSHQKNEKTTTSESQGCADERILTESAFTSPVMFLAQYANVCNKTVNYIINDDRKGKIEITCNFANYKVSSGGKIQEVVKNEVAARMLHMLATSQMEENIVNLPKFSREQILNIMKFEKGDTFIPLAQKLAMVKLYNLCLEQNLPEPQYETKPDKQYEVLSTCTILNYIGKGSGRTEKTAKEKAAEDFYKQHFQKLKNQTKD